jgi:hypothetical protein
MDPKDISVLVVLGGSAVIFIFSLLLAFLFFNLDGTFATGDALEGFPPPSSIDSDCYMRAEMAAVKDFCLSSGGSELITMGSTMPICRVVSEDGYYMEFTVQNVSGIALVSIRESGRHPECEVKK